MTSLDRGRLRDVAAKFSVQFLEAIQPKTKIVILDGAHILRGRTKEENLAKRIPEEQALLQDVEPLTGLRFPLLQKRKDGSFFVEEGRTLWTLYPMIHGRILGTWQELSKAKDEETEVVCETMRSMHDRTRGKLAPFSNLTPHISTGLHQKLPALRHFLSPHVEKRVSHALDRMEEETIHLEPLQHCFVHGDFHHGNAIVDPEGKIIGLIDTDWCGVGHPFEDLGYFVMMYLRSYDREAFAFSEKRYRKALFWYGVGEEEESLFVEFLLGMSFFDLDLFAKQPQSKERDFYLQYQITMLRDLSERFPAEGQVDASLPPPTPVGVFPKGISEKTRTLAAKLNVSSSDIHESVTKGGGPGGQRVNKRVTCVELTHRPTGICVRVQKHRELGRNRIAAYELLLEKVSEKKKGEENAARRERHRLQAQSRPRLGSAKEKVLEEKKKRGEIKRSRRRIA